MTDKIVYWTPGTNNSGQTLQYRSVGSSTWVSSALLPAMTSSYVIRGLDNELYECKVVSTCANSSTQESVLMKTFLTSGNSWTVNALGANIVRVFWNFPSIVHITQINVALYLGNTQLSSQSFSPSQTGQHMFSGLTTSTGYTVMYGLKFDAQTFPENPYTVGAINYLTPTQSLTEYKRLYNIMTF